MHAFWWMLTALAVLALAYRYYSAFIAAKVLALDPSRPTPAHVLDDGANYHPTNKWVLFGHHFAAISGAGPLIGPVLAAQFGFLPGYLWLLFGVVLAGAVQDFVILVGSVRHRGRSLASIARDELGPALGTTTGIAILFIVVISLAGLGRVVVEALAESAWGVFTIGASVPIALAMGLYIDRLRRGSVRGVREATVGGVALLVVALIIGKWVQDGPYAEYAKFSKTTLTVAIGAYGFVASVLPVWVLLCPRDYLSSYLKLGTIFVLVAGVLIVNPVVAMPLVTDAGPEAVRVGAAAFPRVVRGSLFPFVFVTIACGAISGFHALVASGTTPKMIDRETDCRAVGYGAMLMEGLVGITALIAATTLPPPDYFAINTDPSVAVVAPEGKPGFVRTAGDLAALDAPGVLGDRDRRALGLGVGEAAGALAGRSVKASTLLHLSNRALAAAGYHVDPTLNEATALGEQDFLRLGIPVTDLPALAAGAGEVVAARTGGAVSLAVGMARVFAGLPGMRPLLAYWYHFAIMFEALFVLTTIDTGTRIGRFLVQEFVGHAWPRFADPAWAPGAVASTAVVVAGWSYFILTGSIDTIWPMFGVANQLLAMTALCVGTTLILRRGVPSAYALVTLAPLGFVTTATLTAGVEAVAFIYRPMLANPATFTRGAVNATVTSILLVCALAVLVGSAAVWKRLLAAGRPPTALTPGRAHGR